MEKEEGSSMLCKRSDEDDDSEEKEQEIDEEKENGKIVNGDTCRRCKKEVKTSGVQCGMCSSWWHYRCEKKKKVEIDKLGEEMYVCSECKKEN